MKLAPNDLVLLMCGSKCRIVSVQDIMTIQSSGNYICVKTEGDKIGMHVHGAINRCASQLPSSMFFRVNRNCIINLSHVKEAAWLDKRLFLTTKDDQEIICSRIRSQIFRQQRSLIGKRVGVNFDESACE